MGYDANIPGKRSEALALNRPTYFTGRPCRHGHLAERETQYGKCNDCESERLRKKAIAEQESGSYRERHREYMTQYRLQEDWGKQSARRLVRLAFSRGELEKLPCQRCGATQRIHAHHEDYSMPLDVVWLCPKHHSERHKEIAMERCL